jgi:hypothetical protein
LYSVKDLKGIKPASKSTIDMFFQTHIGNEIVTLTIVNGSQSRVMRAITNAILSDNRAIIPIADVDNFIFINKNINGVSIKEQETYIQTLANNSRVKIAVSRGNWSSCMIANIDGTDAVACTLELYDGTTYTKLLDQLSIPAKSTLVLEQNEISFDNSTYDLYATSGDSGGQLTFTFNY